LSGSAMTIFIDSVVSRAKSLYKSEYLRYEVLSNLAQGDDSTTCVRCDMPPADLATVESALESSQLGFELNPKKQIYGPHGFEFLRDWITKDGIFGYPGRIVSSILYSSPSLGQTPVSWDTKLRSNVSVLFTAVQKGCWGLGSLGFNWIFSVVPKALRGHDLNLLKDWVMRSPLSGGLGVAKLLDVKWIARGTLLPSFSKKVLKISVKINLPSFSNPYVKKRFNEYIKENAFGIGGRTEIKWIYHSVMKTPVLESLEPIAVGSPLDDVDGTLWWSRLQYLTHKVAIFTKTPSWVFKYYRGKDSLLRLRFLFSKMRSFSYLGALGSRFLEAARDEKVTITRSLIVWLLSEDSPKLGFKICYSDGDFMKWYSLCKDYYYNSIRRSCILVADFRSWWTQCSSWNLRLPIL